MAGIVGFATTEAAMVGGGSGIVGDAAATGGTVRAVRIVGVATATAAAEAERDRVGDERRSAEAEGRR